MFPAFSSRTKRRGTVVARELLTMFKAVFDMVHLLIALELEYCRSGRCSY
jgi:hypothetical protein